MDPQEQLQGNPAPESMASQAAQPAQSGEVATDESGEYRNFAVLGYIFPFLFFLPLFDDESKKVPFVRFHANQQLILLIVVIAAYITRNLLIMALMTVGYYLSHIVIVAILALVVMGVNNAYRGELKQLPFVGHFKLLK
ncbi:hypothetical protein KC906_00545 [Candidatus Kaiserbacteria bacterium]|nr:hypothetical protein [Candidatus Kaiserbacteria bacterium]MCB9812664.1 hypothetical protein [Candidatus Nomurabacteria bacterium]